jgi:hypothetical protein
MSPTPINSLDLVEMVMSFEEAFDIEIPNGVLEHFGRPSEIVDRFERLLSNQRPNKAAKAWLRKLAREQQRPELAEGLEGTWRREQIAAIVREMLRRQSLQPLNRKLVPRPGAKLSLCLTNVPAPRSGF